LRTVEALLKDTVSPFAMQCLCAFSNLQEDSSLAALRRGDAFGLRACFIVEHGDSNPDQCSLPRNWLRQSSVSSKNRKN